MSNGHTNGQEGSAVWAEAEPPPPRRSTAEKFKVQSVNLWGFLLAMVRMYGVMTIIAGGLGLYIYRTEQDHRADVKQQIENERVDRNAAQAAFLDALAKNTEAVEHVAQEQAVTNVKLDGIQDALVAHAHDAHGGH
jgi:hypothetical protein